MEELRRKSMHGQFYRNIARPSIAKENPWRCYVAQGLKGETEILITAAQDEALSMCYH